MTQELIAGQLQSTSQYQKAQSQAFLSTDFTGSLSATSIQNIPPSQFANVDQIKASSPFTEKDLAIIHVSGMDNKAMVQLGDSSAVQEQDNLTIIGFPGNGDVTNDPSDFLTSSINTVMVSSIKAANTTSPLIQVSGNVEHGDSGGPALDKSGSVVGVVSFGVGIQGSTSFLRSSNSLNLCFRQQTLIQHHLPFRKPGIRPLLIMRHKRPATGTWQPGNFSRYRASIRNLKL